MLESIIERIFPKTYEEILWRGFLQGIEMGIEIAEEDDE